MVSIRSRRPAAASRDALASPSANLLGMGENGQQFKGRRCAATPATRAAPETVPPGQERRAGVCRRLRVVVSWFRAAAAESSLAGMPSNYTVRTRPPPEVLSVVDAHIGPRTARRTSGFVRSGRPCSSCQEADATPQPTTFIACSITASICARVRPVVPTTRMPCSTHSIRRAQASGSTCAAIDPSSRPRRM